MRMMKLTIAFALFMTSASYDSQVISQNGSLDSDWTVSISVTNEAFALEMALEAML